MTQLAEHLHEIQASTRVRALNTYTEYVQTLACLHLATRALTKNNACYQGAPARRTLSEDLCSPFGRIGWLGRTHVPNYH